MALLVVLTPFATRHALSGQVKAHGSAARADRYQVPAGTLVSLRLRTPIDSSSNQANDQVDAVLTEAVTQQGVELIPAGSLVHGTILDAQAASRDVPLGHVAFAFAVIQHGESGSRAPFHTRTITIEAQRLAPAGKRAKSKNPPLDVSWPAGHSLSAVLAEPVIVAIPRSPN